MASQEPDEYTQIVSLKSQSRTSKRFVLAMMNILACLHHVVDFHNFRTGVREDPGFLMIIRRWNNIYLLMTFSMRLLNTLLRFTILRS